MATRDEVYHKFGITAEAAQLFETDLANLIVLCRRLSDKHDIKQNDIESEYAKLDLLTLGKLINELKNIMGISDETKKKFNDSLKIRNRLFHEFYRHHNFNIDDDDGRDLMIQDLEEMHDDLFKSWRLASAIYDGIVRLTINIFTGKIEPISESEEIKS